MEKGLKIIIVLMVALPVLGCYGYRAYMGLHGNSIKLYPDIHKAVVADRKCLECHHPDKAEGPPAPHPNFKGCIKCHNDEIESDKKQDES